MKIAILLMVVALGGCEFGRGLAQGWRENQEANDAAVLNTGAFMAAPRGSAYAIYPLRQQNTTCRVLFGTLYCTTQ